MHIMISYLQPLIWGQNQTANQTAPEKVEHEATSTYNVELYGLFSSLGKVADSQEEQKVG
jgi:hypothetical protein